METATERVYRLLLTHPKTSWVQRELAARAACSRGYVSRIVGSLVAGGILARPYKNRVVLVSPAKLLTLWAARRLLPTPAYVVTSRTPEGVEGILRDIPGSALTLFRAAWHRTRFMAASTVEAYVPEGRLEAAVERIGVRSADPTSVALYPTDGAALEGAESRDDVPLVSVAQNVVDLMALGGQGPRVALHVAKSYGLWEA